jgi:hypothetical protein
MILTQEFLDMFVDGESSSDLHYQNSLDNVCEWRAFVFVSIPMSLFMFLQEL